MTTVELDVAFTPSEVAGGLERLFSTRGWTWVPDTQPAPRYHFRVGVPSGGETVVTVEPLPNERLNYPTFFPRTLVQVRAADAASLEAMRSAILFSFLRLMG